MCSSISMLPKDPEETLNKSLDLEKFQKNFGTISGKLKHRFEKILKHFRKFFPQFHKSLSARKYFKNLTNLSKKMYKNFNKSNKIARNFGKFTDHSR